MIGSRECCALVLLVSSLCSGCASVVSGRHAEVEVFSNVPGALVTIHDKNGKPVATTSTPGTIALRRQRGLLRPKGYTGTIAAQGYQSEQFEINQKINPWVFGNAGFFQLGLIGWAVDNATGAVWQPADSTYYSELTPVHSAAQGPLISARTPEDKIQLTGAEVYVTDEAK